MSEIKQARSFDFSALEMADKPPRDLRNGGMRAPSVTLIAAVACVAAIALAGLASLFLQTPGNNPLPPAEIAAVRTQSQPTAEIPGRPASEQTSTAAVSVSPATPPPRMLPAQAPTSPPSQTSNLSLADAVVPPDERTGILPAPAAAPATPQASNAPVRPNFERRQIVTLDRSGVNIRSAPSASSRVVGSAPKGTRFEVARRNGRWVEIESDAIKGWVSGRFLEPDQPASEGRFRRPVE